MEGVKSRLIQVISGISQGTVISALLFLIFINDLPESVKKSFTGLFCDDTLMAKEIHNNNDATELQKDLEAVEEWSKMWGMQFNTLKSEVMTITNVRKPIETTYNLSGKDLDKKESIKYLGVWIDNKLSFKKHIEEKVKKSKTVLNMLRRNLLFAPKSVKAKAYISTVRPIIETASICWSPSADKYKKMIEGVQHSAAQFVANYYPKKGKYEEYSISKLIKELGWTPLEERRNQAKLIMAYKILNNKVILNPESLPKKHYARQPRSCNLATSGLEMSWKYLTQGWILQETHFSSVSQPCGTILSVQNKLTLPVLKPSRDTSLTGHQAMINMETSSCIPLPEAIGGFLL